MADYNAVWVGGVHLDRLVSGDIDARFEERFREAKAGPGEWVGISFPGGSYTVWVGPTTDVLFQHVP
jgi:hypothetical protein